MVADSASDMDGCFAHVQPGNTEDLDHRHSSKVDTEELCLQLSVKSCLSLLTLWPKTKTCLVMLR